MKKRLLIIPARKGSQRIKNKNIKKFKKKPIIGYPINAAKKSKLFKKIIVSTNSKKIKLIVNKLGAEVINLRPVKLSKNTTPVFDVIKHEYLNIKKELGKFDEIWCILPCTPLLTFKDLMRVSKEIDKKKKLPLISIAKYPAPIEWSYKMKKKNKLIPLNKRKNLKSSKSFKDKFYDAGAFYVFDEKTLLNTKTINLYSEFYGHLMPYEKVIDIDDMEDWKTAIKLKNLDSN